MENTQRVGVIEVAETDMPFGPQQGRKDLAAIEARLSPERRVVALDMSRLRLVDTSWARVVVGSLLQTHRGGHVFYLDRVTHAIVSENVGSALLARGACVLARHEGGSYEVVGRQPSEQALEVLRLIEERGEATARTICAAIDGLSIQACNNRLRDLVGAGLIMREEGQIAEGSREYVYRALR